MRAERRDSFRATVFECVTPLPAARCISGCAARNACVAASLLPPAIATSTFLMKVRMRDLRAWLRSVRVWVCRMRLRADAVLAMCFFRLLKQRNPAAAAASGERSSMHGSPASQESLRTVRRARPHGTCSLTQAAVAAKSSHQVNWKNREIRRQKFDAKALSMVRDSIALRRLMSSCSSGHFSLFGDPRPEFASPPTTARKFAINVCDTSRYPHNKLANR